MYLSKGFLEYNDDYTRLVLRIDQQIVDYYFSLIPDYKNVIRQRWDAHITVVRTGRDIVINKEYWKKHNEVIEYNYDGIIRFGKVYYWIDAYSDNLNIIRQELGLPIRERYHFTIGNVK